MIAVANIKAGLQVRNIATIRKEELLHAAKWWAHNASMMTDADPWKSHAAVLPYVALVAESPAVVEAWLRVAHQAVGACAGNIYECAWVELMSEMPPWSKAHPMSGMHDEPWCVNLARSQLAALMGEIRSDSAIQRRNLSLNA